LDRKVRKIRQAAIGFLSLVLVGNTFLVSVKAASIENSSITNEKDCVEIDLILNEKYTVEQFGQIIKEYYPEIEISSTPEIQLIHLIIPASINADSFLEDEIIQSFIYAKGKLPVVSIPKNPTSRVDLSATNLSIYNQYKARMTEEELFDTMAWHVDEVTNHRMSLDIAAGEGTRIGIIDSGVDTEHPQLVGKINTSISCSYVTGESDISDSNGHGTGVTGIVTQIAPEAEIVAYKVIGADTGESTWVIEALIQAVKDQCKIINMSLGTYKCETIESELLTIEAFERAVEYAELNGCIVVASAGNKALDLDQYYETEHMKHLPGGIKSAVTVSAKHKTALASYSNFGSDVDLCAPGGDLSYIEGMVDISQWIYCLYPANMNNGLESLGVPQGYSFSYGTSFAAPIVAASFADMWSYYLKNGESVSMQHILEDIINEADDIGAVGKDKYFGSGAVNLYKSLIALTGQQ